MNSKNQRFKDLRGTLKLSQEAFGNAMGLSKSGISNIENGIRKVTDQHIKLICSEFNVNEEWLSTGEGEMFVQSETFSLDEKARQHNLTDLEIDIMRGYMELPPETRNSLMQLFDNVYGKRNETAATTEQTPEQIAEEEAESYRQEVLAELKTQKSSASDEEKGKSS